MLPPRPFEGMSFFISLVVGLTSIIHAESTVPFAVEERTCLTQGCHTAVQEQRFLHAPILQGDCSDCHVPPGEQPQGLDYQVSEVHDLVTIAPVLELCGDCHTEDRFVHGDWIHEPFTNRCDTCHDPHGGDVRHFLHTETPGALCSSCHEDIPGEHDYAHGPLVLGLCLECHTPHRSEFEGLLRDTPEALCIDCHRDVGSGLRREHFLHAPAETGCLDCHDAHGGAHRFFLPTTQEELCRSCHEETIVSSAEMAFPHAEMLEGRTCSSCHAPHFSSHEGLLRRSSLDTCSRCHDEPVESLRGTPLAPVTQTVRAAENVHGPLEEGNCVACHAAHGSDERLLLKGSFPQGLYAVYREDTYSLCYTCHDRRLAEEEFTETTGFRDGERNLHFVHVNRERGRTCAVCHDAHAADADFLLRDFVQYGAWEMELRFTPAATGGSCQDGCHGLRSYERLPAANGGR